MSIKIFILLISVGIASAKLGIDVSQLHTQEILTCFVKEGYSFIVARAWKSFGGIDTNA